MKRLAESAWKRIEIIVSYIAHRCPATELRNVLYAALGEREIAGDLLDHARAAVLTADLDSAAAAPAEHEPADQLAAGAGPGRRRIDRDAANEQLLKILADDNDGERWTLRKTFDRAVAVGDFPKADVRRGAKLVQWRWETVLAGIDKLAATSREGA